MPTPTLRDEIAIVTGGSRGLGYLLARGLLARGCKVAICARDEIDLEEARAALASGARAEDVLAVPCDVGKRDEVERMVREVAERWGRIDLLVNNAGVIQAGPLESMRVEDFEQAMDVMFWGVVHPTLAVLPLMKGRRHGRIATITSIGGKVSVPHLLPYDCAKFAAVGFSEGLRAELTDEKGISVTTVVPGFMRTGSHVNARFKGDARREAALFGLLANAPLLTMDAERAADKILDAIEKRESEIVLTLPAKLAMWTQGLAPGLSARIAGVAGTMLPKGSETHGRGVRGETAMPDSEAYRAATRMGEEAAERWQR